MNCLLVLFNKSVTEVRFVNVSTHDKEVYNFEDALNCLGREELTSSSNPLYPVRYESVMRPKYTKSKERFVFTGVVEKANTAGDWHISLYDVEGILRDNTEYLNLMLESMEVLEAEYDLPYRYADFVKEFFGR